MLASRRSCSARPRTQEGRAAQAISSMRERHQADEERKALELRQDEARSSIVTLEDQQRSADEQLSDAQRTLFDARETVEDARVCAPPKRVPHTRRSWSARQVWRRKFDGSKTRTASSKTRAQSLAARARDTTRRSRGAARRGDRGRSATRRRHPSCSTSCVRASRRATMPCRRCGLPRTNSRRPFAWRAASTRPFAHGLRVRRRQGTAESDLSHLASTCIDTVQATLDEVMVEVEELERTGAAVPDARVICADEPEEGTDEDGRRGRRRRTGRW